MIATVETPREWDLPNGIELKIGIGGSLGDPNPGLNMHAVSLLHSF